MAGLTAMLVFHQRQRRLGFIVSRVAARQTTLPVPASGHPTAAGDVP